MEKLSKKLLRIGKEIINEDKKPMTPLTDDKKIKHEGSKKCYVINHLIPINKENITKTTKKLEIIVTI